MNRHLLQVLIAVTLSAFPRGILAQQPVLGTTSDFALFTAVGAFSNDGATIVTGDIGTNVGAFSGFPPGTVIGDIHVVDGASAQAATDVATAFASFAAITCGQVIGTTLGSGQTLTPDVYCLGAASTLNGNLILDAAGDPNATFIFKIDGALSTTTLSSVTLINGASLCNVYWQVNGQFEQGPGSTFRGTVVVNGAIILLEGADLYGRAVSQAGAVELHNNIVTMSQQPFAADISAGGAISFCIGGSVVLSGNLGGTWSTGATTPTITVSTSGDFYVTNTNECGTDTSNVITVTVNPLPVCTISGDLAICDGATTELCAPAGASSYLWSNGATTACITVSAAGAYSVTVTDGAGCSSTCNVTVDVTASPVCTITGGLTICDGAT
ncbi:MAG: ice-binding family protein, partial [Flavobacteriales bacterium]